MQYSWSCFPRTFGDGQSGAPLVSQDVQADAAVAVDVRVVDAGGEVDLRRLEGVVGGEVDREEEDAAGVGGVARAHDGRLPVELRMLCQYRCLAAIAPPQARFGGALTRSSPIGPALHDEGGSRP